MVTREVVLFPKQSRSDFDAYERRGKDVVPKEVERLNVQPFANEDKALSTCDGLLLG